MSKDQRTRSALLEAAIDRIHELEDEVRELREQVAALRRGNDIDDINRWFV